MGFAVIDLETTGLNPFKYDRIVEVAVVHVERDGEISGVWETLVNPDRDLGPQSIHGIRASDAMQAPRFEQIAGDLVGLLRGRAVVAHNAPFDCRFLEAEFARMGAPDVALVDQALCTIRLTRAALPGVNRTLAGCCAAFDIEIENAHHARGDAVATARLLGALLRDQAIDRSLASLANSLVWPASPSRGARWFPRTEGDREANHFLERVVADLPQHTGPEAHEAYLALLDRCLLDRHLTLHEQNELVALASVLGIDRAVCAGLHDVYFEHLATSAWADGVLTDAERRDLLDVAALLGISSGRVSASLDPRRPTPSAPPPPSAAVGRFRLEEGDRVVLTGDMRRPRHEWHEVLFASGLEPVGSMSRRVKLVAAADPDSLSGKAKKARAYGIPIVDEAGLTALVDSFRTRR